MRFVLITALSLCNLLLSTTASVAAGCPPAPPTSIYVADDFTLGGPYQTLSDEELFESEGVNSKRPVPVRKVYGTTKHLFLKDGQFEYSIEPADDLGNVCIHMKNINLNIRFQSDVYIEQSRSPGTCEYDVVLEHEMRHAHIAKDMYQKHRKIFADTMKDFFSTIPNVFVAPADIETYKSDLDSKVREKLNALSEEAWTDIVAKASSIDTRAEYLRVQNFCH